MDDAADRVDGIHLKVRLEEKLCLLVMIGWGPSPDHVVVALGTGATMAAGLSAAWAQPPVLGVRCGAIDARPPWSNARASLSNVVDS